MQSQDDLAGCRVPDLDRLIVTGRGHALAVGSEGNSSDDARVPLECCYIAASHGIPDAHRPIVVATDQEGPAGVEGQTGNLRDFLARPDQDRASGGIKHGQLALAGDAVLAGQCQTPAVGTVGHTRQWQLDLDPEEIRAVFRVMNLDDAVLAGRGETLAVGTVGDSGYRACMA